MYGRNLKAYRKTSVSAEISVADPYVITKMLYQGLFERLAQAKGSIQRGDLATKAAKLASACAIIENLKSALDFNHATEVANNLSKIYTFMLDCIADASVNVDTNPIDDAMKVFAPIKEAWDKIPVSAQIEANKLREDDHFKNEFTNTESLATGTI